jgi:hypothetical protein
MIYHRLIALSLFASGFSVSVQAQIQNRKIQFPINEKAILPKANLSGFYSLVRQGKLKDATALVDHLQTVFPEEQEVERNFIMLFICQDRDSEVVSRASKFVEIQQLREWMEIPVAKLKLKKLFSSTSVPAKPVNIKATQANPLQQAYSRTLVGSNWNEWVRFGCLNRVLRDDPTNPEGICCLFGTLSNEECLSKMRTFSLQRLEAAAFRADPSSNQKILRKYIEIKK